MKWIVAQIGAREHYATARALHQQASLQLMFTEAWASHARSLLQRGPAFCRALAARFHHALPASHIRACTLSTLLDESLRRLRTGTSASRESVYLEHIRIGQRFCRFVNRHLQRTINTASSDSRLHYFGYNTGCRETLPLLREHRIPSFVDQIDPARTEEELVSAEQQRFPDWEPAAGRIPDVYYQRLSDEWQQADCVLVNSPWAQQALIQQAVPAHKIRVLPLAYEAEHAQSGQLAQQARLQRISQPNQPLTVLWLGSVILRKGIPYLLQAAQQLTDRSLQFLIAGPLLISASAQRTAPRNVQFLGRVTRDRAAALYAQADLFVLPTISDGFAITQVEAMAYGLPVLTTPNCGQVVTHQQDGLIVPARDSDALAQALIALDSDRSLLAHLCEHTLEKSRQFTLDRYAANLTAIAGDFHAPSPR